MDLAREVSCQRRVNGGKDRCPWRGPLADFADHTAATLDDPDGPHVACLLCRRPLRDDERGSCFRCIDRLDVELAQIVELYATLPDIIERTALRTGRLPGGNALVLLADGSVEGGGPDDDIKYRDPLLILATLHVIWERDWRETFGHGHAPKWQATVSTTVGYLRTWLRLAARTHDAFDDFARDVHVLHSELAHITGRADDPLSANANCTRCGGRLERAYRPPVRETQDRIASGLRAAEHVIAPVRAQRAAERTYGLRGHQLTPWPGAYREREVVELAVRGVKDEGLDDVAVCADCGHTYTSGEYRIALRIKGLAAATGWITPAAAASLLERPVQTIWTWIRRMEVLAAVLVESRRTVVEVESLKRKGRAARRADEPTEEAS